MGAAGAAGIDICKFRLVHRFHHQPVDRHRPGIHRVVHLIETARRLLWSQCGVVSQHRRRPGAGKGAVGGGNIELDHGAVRLHRQGSTEDPVAREGVTVQPVIGHGRNGKSAAAIGPPGGTDGGHQAMVVGHPGGDVHRIGGFRNHRKMRDVADDRRDIRSRHRVGRARRATRRETGQPVLTSRVVESHVDEFERSVLGENVNRRVAIWRRLISAVGAAVP